MPLIASNQSLNEALTHCTSALPPLDPMRLRYCLMDSSTERPIYYLTANKQSEPFREERCPVIIWTVSPYLALGFQSWLPPCSTLPLSRARPPCSQSKLPDQ